MGGAQSTSSVRHLIALLALLWRRWSRARTLARLVRSVRGTEKRVEHCHTDTRQVPVLGMLNARWYCSFGATLACTLEPPVERGMVSS
jgi:hypothetical protein